MRLVDGERYTHHPSPEADALIHQLVGEVAALVKGIVPEDFYHALVLIGGYGRGEGGIREVGGIDLPNNNLDFLLISRGSSNEQASDWQRRINAGLESLQESYGISVDFSMITARSLTRSASRIMWYDMKWGHKTVLGDPEFVTSMHRFRIENVPSWDVHNLLVNRGTLLVINDCLPKSDEMGELDRIRSRHTIKAVIGYGDALLYARGKYHWSYAEKQRRMRFLDSVPPDFRRMYDEAAEHRFRPAGDLPESLSDAATVRRSCEAVHLTCEALRLRQANLDWHRYLEFALGAGLWEDASPRGLVRNLRNAWQSCREGSHCMPQDARHPLGHLGVAARWGLRTLSTQRMLGLLFPAVAYDDCPNEFRCSAAALLGARDIDQDSLRLAYLRTWGDTVDRNFARFLDRFGISLQPKETYS